MNDDDDNTIHAFPAQGNDTYDGYYGMSLRDYFAAKAMALVMPPVLEEIRKRNFSDKDVTLLKKVAAGACYGIADEMLEARK